MVDREGCVDVVYLNFCSAFDKVPRRRLLHKLCHFGVRGELLRWISSFLSEREFTVKVGSLSSDNRPVLSGVPQGSVLGPLLFLAYISDIPSCIRSFCSFFADDAKIYDDPLRNHLGIQSDLDNISRWTRDWVFPLNSEDR